MSYLHRLAWLLIAVLGLSGCIAYNQQPLSDPGAARIDEALLGSWVSTNPDNSNEKLELDITRDGDHQVLIALTSYEADGSTRQHVYHAHSSIIGDRQYLNVYASEQERDLRGYMTVRYGIDNQGTLNVSLLDDDAARGAIQTDGLEGMVSTNSQFSDITITAAPAPFAAYLRAHEADLFPRESIFTRPAESTK